MSCKNKLGIIFKKECYPSGKIKRCGYFLKDSIPIDTIYTFYENGKIKSIAVYDSLGKLNGISKIYFDNGYIKQELTYSNNLVQGIMNDYGKLGNIKSKSFYYNDISIGDYYEFINNKIDYYAFYDFKNHKINHIEYDSSGKIIKDIRQNIFLDSVNFHLDSKKNYVYEILLLISNPIKVSNSTSINYLDHDGKSIYIDSINNGRHYFFIQRKFKSNLLNIRIFAKQYDSISHQTKLQSELINIQYQ